MATLFLNVSFSADRDLITGSDMAIFFSKSKSIPETNKDSPKAYKKSPLAKIKQRKRRSKYDLQHVLAQAFEYEATLHRWTTSPSEDLSHPWRAPHEPSKQLRQHRPRR